MYSMTLLQRLITKTRGVENIEQEQIKKGNAQTENGKNTSSKLANGGKVVDKPKEEKELKI